MALTLYEIDRAIMDCLDAETGEILDIEKLEELQLAKEVKIENIALWYLNLCAEAEAYKAEKLKFEEKQKKAEQAAENKKKWLDSILQGSKFKTTLCEIKYSTSSKVIVDDITAIDSKYYKAVKPEADKTKIKAAIKAGEIIEGCHIETNKNISIK